MKGTNAVTTHEPFGINEGLPLFCVNAGIPTDYALEQASNLMSCVEAMSAARGLPDRELESDAIQYLAQAAKALVRACRSAAPEATAH